MFTIDNFWEIFKLLKGESVEGLNTVTQAVAKSEQGKVSNLFSSVINQVSFDTEDYNNLRKFLIDWYASHRTITSIQNQTSDPFSIPDEHLDELFRSFGFNYSTKLSTMSEDVNVNKVNFFLDLVNLYKVKGTPYGLLKALQYFGLIGVDILEYWLQKDENGNLVFKSDIVASTTPTEENLEIPFSALTKEDPHWILTESQILQLSENQKINFPSKSPYFGIRPTYESSVTNYIVSRIIQDQHDEYESTGSIAEQNAIISCLNITASFLELYLSSVYIFNNNYIAGTDDNPFICYDGTSVIYTDIISEYNALITADPTTREIREARLKQYYDNFTRPQSINFFQNKDTAGIELEKINPSLKSQLDIMAQSESAENITISLLLDISKWVSENITLGILNLAYIVFGTSGIKYHLGDIINFFKSYRARLILSEVIILKNRLLDSVRLADSLASDHEITIMDWDTANSKPCCVDPLLNCPDSTCHQWYSRETYDCGSFYDIGAAYDGDGPEVYIEDEFYDSLTCIPNDSTNNIIVHSGSYDSTADVEIVTELKNSIGFENYDDISKIHWQSGGFLNFDDGGSFDCTTGFDICQIFVQECLWVKYVLYDYPPTSSDFEYLIATIWIDQVNDDIYELTEFTDSTTAIWIYLGNNNDSENVVIDTDENINLTIADLNKVLLVDSTSSITVNLPAVSNSNVGDFITIHKIGMGAITIRANGTDMIEDSIAGGSASIIFNNQTFANIDLFLAKADLWKFKNAPLGSWVIT